MVVRLRNMIVSDISEVAELVALDHDTDREKGSIEARQHTVEHLQIVPQHCYVVQKDGGSIVGVMILYPQKEIFEIENFHVTRIPENREALNLLKDKLLE